MSYNFAANVISIKGNKLKFKVKAGLIAIAALSACVGVEDVNVNAPNSPLVDAPNSPLSGSAPGSVQLSASQTVVANNSEELRAINWDNSEVGARIEVDGGILEGVNVTILKRAGDFTTLRFQNVGDSEIDNGDYSSNNWSLSLELSVEEGTSGASNSNSVEYVNQQMYGEDVWLSVKKDWEIGSGSISRFTTTQDSEGEPFGVSIDRLELADENGLTFTTIGNPDSEFIAPTPQGGMFYYGPTDLFVASSRLPQRGMGSINVDFQTGVADLFAEGLDGAVDFTIRSDLTVDVANGTLSGTGNALLNGDLIGITTQGSFSPSADAVAGFIVPNEAGELEGGIFVYTEDPS